MEVQHVTDLRRHPKGGVFRLQCRLRLRIPVGDFPPVFTVAVAWTSSGSESEITHESSISAAVFLHLRLMRRVHERC